MSARTRAFFIVAVLCGGRALAAQYTEVRAEAARLLDTGVAAYNRGAFDEAVTSLSKAAGIALNSFRVNYYLGLALTAARRPAEAVDALEVAIDLEPANAQAHIAMGNARLRGGDPDEAAAAFARALKLRSE